MSGDPRPSGRDELDITASARQSSPEASGTTPDIQHHTFTVAAHLTARPAVVFEAFADPIIRRRWFNIPGSDASYDHDFRITGGEIASSTFKILDRPPERLENRSRYIDIVPNERIVYIYEAYIDDVLRWTSLVTVQFQEDSGDCQWPLSSPRART